MRPGGAGDYLKAIRILKALRPLGRVGSLARQSIELQHTGAHGVEWQEKSSVMRTSHGLTTEQSWRWQRRGPSMGEDFPASVVLNFGLGSPNVVDVKQICAQIYMGSECHWQHGEKHADRTDQIFATIDTSSKRRRKIPTWGIL